MDTTKLSDIREALAIGNHRGTKQFQQFFEECLDDDGRHGFSLVLLRQHALNIPGLLLAPHNIIDQHTINARGEIEPPIHTLAAKPGRAAHISATDMIMALRSVVLVLGEHKLGILSSEVGTHSLRSGAEMVMHLVEIYVYTSMIMEVGSWTLSYSTYVSKSPSSAKT